MKIAPSLPSADFSRVKSQIQEVKSAGADVLHLDVMDGRFVPNITWGPKIVSDLRGMSVNPGFGGEPFLPHSLKKIREARTLIDDHNPNCELEVDGGIGHRCIVEVARAGATVAVTGLSIFNVPDPGDAVRDFRARLQGEPSAD